jgi:hypothetical protein
MFTRIDAWTKGQLSQVQKDELARAVPLVFGEGAIDLLVDPFGLTRSEPADPDASGSEDPFAGDPFEGLDDFGF